MWHVQSSLFLIPVSAIYHNSYHFYHCRIMYNHCLLNVIHHHQKQTCQSNEDLSSHVLLKYFITCNATADACQTTHFVNSITTQMAQSPLGLTLEPNHSGSIRELMATWARQLQALPLPRKKYLFVVDSLDKSDDVVWGL